MVASKTSRKSKGGAPAVVAPTFADNESVEWDKLTPQEKLTIGAQDFAALGISNLPSTPETVAVAKCYGEINARSDDGVTRNAERLAESMRRRGYDAACPIVVSAKSKGRYLILRGHSRHRAAGIVGLETVPAVVYSGLTPAQELAIMADQTADAAAQSWTDAEFFAAIEKLVVAGYQSQAALACHFGWFTRDKQGNVSPARNKMQLRVEAVSLARRIPSFRAALTRGLTPGYDGSEPIVKWQHVRALKKADSEDCKSGVTDGTGAKYQEAWTALVGKQAGQAGSDKSSLTPTAATKRAEITSSAILRDAYLVATGQGAAGLTFEALDARAVEAEAALALVTRLTAFDADAFAALCEACNDANPVAVA